MVGVYDSSERLLGAHESSGAKFGKGKSGVSSCHHKVRHSVAKRVVSREPALRFTRCRLLGSFADSEIEVFPAEDDGAFSGRPRNGLHVDHMPSQAAIRRYLQNNFRTLTATQVDEYLKKVAGVAIPARVHQKFSETYGGRNTETKQLQDADDLRTALDSNFNAIEPYMLEEGFAGADLEVARRGRGCTKSTKSRGGTDGCGHNQSLGQRARPYL